MFTTLHVKAPAGEDNSPRRMQRADKTINTAGGMFNVPPNADGMPTQKDDGTYEVRIIGGGMAVDIVKAMLTEHEGLTIIPEEESD